ncbi:hypothetical protein [Chitinophaga filiformis]|uniref:Uncharacterized protein n=1 Tax=Chitinophaga filiformis TaxID=104663 RepID=A0A1G7P298_CHIFI|nr:hypothetical protein [Chitinophaga filiformis]SDF80426.1 hypothetical protein SAMN04488121_1021037 [Chitinophaga filiformis]
MTGLSPWAATSMKELAGSNGSLFSKNIGQYCFYGHSGEDSLWITAAFNEKIKIAFRTAYSPDGPVINNITREDNRIFCSLTSQTGHFEVEIQFPDNEKPVLRYTVRFQAAAAMAVPFWPRDILIISEDGSQEHEGEIYIPQVGMRSGLIYAGITKPESGSFLYLQNFSALNDYFSTTMTSPADTVGGTWPELGFSLPPTKDKLLPPDRMITIADAFIAFDPVLPDNQFTIARQFIDRLADLYIHLPRPAVAYHDYRDVLNRSLKDIETTPGCWCYHGGKSYLNAYVSDYKNPPEVMVQLAVLLPLLDYAAWLGKDLPLMGQLKDVLWEFYDKDKGFLRRWLPLVDSMLDGSEPHKVPDVMDSWYLYHPLLNLSRMALAGDDTAKDLFLKSLEFSIKVARHFNYRWPVFYNVNTLEVIKEETAPGEGGEKDVAGIYAHVMLQAWELTGDKRYFEEAEKAAQSLTAYGFKIMYQSNNTAFSTGAMLRLYNETKNELYLNLSYLFFANLFANVALWQCDYGNLKHFPLFFALFPLTNAPYIAVYEEQECFAAFHNFLALANDTPLLRSAALLIAEFIRHFVSRAVHYCPPVLPKEMLSEEAKTGEIAPHLWVALEDIHDGWEKSGVVGQEVYGAGLAFGIVPRHYFKSQEGDFMIFVDYPTADRSMGNPIKLKVLGDKTLQCRLRILSLNGQPLTGFTVRAGTDQQLISSEMTSEGHLEYIIYGDQVIEINKQK